MSLSDAVMAVISIGHIAAGALAPGSWSRRDANAQGERRASAVGKAYFWTMAVVCASALLPVALRWQARPNLFLLVVPVPSFYMAEVGRATDLPMATNMCVTCFSNFPWQARQAHPRWPREAFPLDSATAQVWLAEPADHSFTYNYNGNVLTLTVRKKRLKRGGDHWYAYARLPDGRLHKRYVGKTAAVTLARLHALAMALRYGR